MPGFIKNISIAVVIASLAITAVHAQMFTLPNPHFVNNRYAFNPSLAGSLRQPYIAVNYRKQSIGNLRNTPQYYFLSAEIPSKYGGNNFGLQAYSRKAGLFMNNFVAAHYAIQVRPGPYQKIRMGIGGGVKFSMLDLKNADANDPVLQSWNNKTYPLLQAGLSYNNRNFWIGASLQDILYEEINSQNTYTYNRSLLPWKNYNAFMSYKFKMSEEFSLETAFLHRSKEYTAHSFELNMTGNYQDKFWVAASYRTDIGPTVMAGFKISGFLSGAVGYKSNDFVRRDANAVSNPAYDILLGLYGRRELKDEEEEWQELQEMKEEKKEQKKEKKTIPPPTPPVVKKDTSFKPATTEVVKGKESNDLNYNYYVVVGAFSSSENALKYASQITGQKKIDAKVGYNSVKKLYYVYVYVTDSYESAREWYNKYRGTNEWTDIWILRIIKDKNEK